MTNTQQREPSNPNGGSRFAGMAERAEAILLNERGWLGCRVCANWTDAEVGMECPTCGTPLQEERKPDRGSAFEAFLAEYRKSH